MVTIKRFAIPLFLTLTSLIIFLYYDYLFNLSIYSSNIVTTHVTPIEELPLILDWNKIHWQDIFIDGPKCPDKCIFTRNKTFEANASIITVYMGDGALNTYPTSKNSNRMIGFLNHESPTHRPFYSKVPKDLFNFTVTYRLDSDFPIPYDCLKELKPNDTDVWNPKKVDAAIKKKSKTALFLVSHCGTDSKREKFVAELRKHINITQLGRCNKKPCNKKCEDAEIEQHYFTLAFENSICTDYITEKVYRFRQLIVPVILDRSVIRSDQLNLNPYVIAASDFKSITELSDYLIYLTKNQTAYKKYFEWTKIYKKSKSCHLFENFACYLCSLAWKIKNGYRKTIPNLHDWWGKDKCQQDFGLKLYH